MPLVRLQKYLAEAGACSRRAAEALIAQGEVWVDGVKATLGQKIEPGEQKVVVSGTVVPNRTQAKMTLAVHKPRGLVCSNDDPHNPETIFGMLPRELQRMRFFCAGRLDKESEGLVILTTDGDLAHRLMHPSNEVVKRYRVETKIPFPPGRLKTLVKGVTLEGERLKVERATLLHPGPDGSSRSIDVAMHHGRKREIRQLFGLLGYDVRRLRRYQIGMFRLEGIPLRAGKQLSKKEIEMLFRQPPAPLVRPTRPRAAVFP
jgi:23S rRNA pseudouridine2605 synthase